MRILRTYRPGPAVYFVVAAFVVRLALLMLIVPDLEGLHDSFGRTVISEELKDAMLGGYLTLHSFELCWIWLPLPFVWNAVLGIAFGNTLSASIAFNMIISSISVGLMYKIGEKLAGRTAGMASAILLLVSPLYSLYSCTTLTEGLLVISLLAGLWYLIISKERPKYVVASAVFLLIASLTRYEGWWFVPFFVLWMLRSGMKGNRAAWVAMAIAVAGPIIWLGLNLALYGNPLWFKSALAEYIAMYNAERPNFSLRGPLQLFEALVAFILASVHAVPPALAALSSGVRKRAGRAAFLPLGLTILYAGFLYYGFLSGSTQPYYRYGVPLAPLFFLLVGVLFSATPPLMRRWLSALGFVMLLVMVLMTAEVIRSGTGKPQIDAGRFLRELPDGKVLAPSPIVRLASGLGYERFKDKMLGVDSRTLVKDRVRYIVAVESECDVADLADSLLADMPGRPARARILRQFTPPATTFVFRFGTNAFTNSLSEHQGRVRVLELLF